MAMPDFMGQFNDSLRSGAMLGQARLNFDSMRQQQEQQAKEFEAKQKQNALTMQIMQNNEARTAKVDKEKEYLQYAVMLASMNPKDQDQMIVQMQNQLGDKDPMLSTALTNVYKQQGQERDTTLFGIIDALSGKVRKSDSQVEKYFGIKGLNIDNMTTTQRDHYTYALMSPEARGLEKERVNMRDQSPEELLALETVKNNAKLNLTNLDDKGAQLRGYVAQGQAAKPLITNLGKAIEIQRDLQTGGTAAARAKLANYFGIESATTSSMAELNSLLGGIVLGQIRQLGANPTEGERKFLLDTIGNIEQSRTANLPIMERMLKEAQAQYERGRNSYVEVIQMSPDYRSTVFDSAFGLTAPQQQQQPPGAPPIQIQQQQPGQLPGVQTKPMDYYITLGGG